MGKSINVQNYYLAEITEDLKSSITHSKPEKVFGLMKAKRVPLSSEGSMYEEGILTEELSEIIGHNLSFDFGDLPQKWRAWMNGYTISDTGIMSDEGKPKPKPFAVGWEVIRADGSKQMVWYLYCKAKPIEDDDAQREKDIKYSNDTIVCSALKKEQFKYRAFTLADTKNVLITDEIQKSFFEKVQTTDTISKS